MHKQNIIDELERLRKAQMILNIDDRASDQCFGAAQTLKWILDPNNTPPPHSLAKPLTKSVNKLNYDKK